MVRVIEYFAWLVIFVGFLIAFYYGYRLYDESAKSGENIVRPSPYLFSNLEDKSPKMSLSIKDDVPAFSMFKKRLSQCKKVLELEVRELKRTFPIFYSSNEHSEAKCLERGAVIINRGGNTVFPGEQGLSVISGHRDTHFSSFAKLVKEVNGKLEADIGQYFVLNDSRYDYIYQLREVSLVHKSTEVIRSYKENKSLLYVTTCYPFGMIGRAPNRLIFKLELVKKSSNEGFILKK